MRRLIFTSFLYRYCKHSLNSQLNLQHKLNSICCIKSKNTVISVNWNQINVIILTITGFQKCWGILNAASLQIGAKQMYIHVRPVCSAWSSISIVLFSFTFAFLGFIFYSHQESPSYEQVLKNDFLGTVDNEPTRQMIHFWWSRFQTGLYPFNFLRSKPKFLWSLLSNVSLNQTWFSCRMSVSGTDIQEKNAHVCMFPHSSTSWLLYYHDYCTHWRRISKCQHDSSSPDQALVLISWQATNRPECSERQCWQNSFNTFWIRKQGEFVHCDQHVFVQIITYKIGTLMVMVERRGEERGIQYPSFLSSPQWWMNQWRKSHTSCPQDLSPWQLSPPSSTSTFWK